MMRYDACPTSSGCVRTGDFKSVVLKSRRESAHARTFGGDFELKILRMRGFSSRFWTMDLKSPVPLALHCTIAIGSSRAKFCPFRDRLSSPCLKRGRGYVLTYDLYT